MTIYRDECGKPPSPTYHVGDLVLGVSGAPCRVRRVGPSTIEAWLCDDPETLEMFKREDGRIVRSIEPGARVDFRTGDVVMMKDDNVEATVLHPRSAEPGTLVPILWNGFAREVPAELLWILRRPAMLGDVLTYYPADGGEDLVLVATSGATAAYRTDSGIERTIAIGRDGFSRWEHANTIPIAPAGRAVRGAGGKLLGRTVERNTKLDAIDPNERIDELRAAMSKHIHATGYGPGSPLFNAPTSSTLRDAKTIGLEPMSGETDEALRARCRAAFDRFKNAGTKSALRELIEANISPCLTVEAAIIALLGVDELARAMFMADREVNEHVHRMAETPKVIINPKPQETAERIERVRRAFAVAWDRYEPKGARERAEENASRMLEVLRLGVFAPLPPKVPLVNEREREHDGEVTRRVPFGWAEAWGPCIGRR